MEENGSYNLAVNPGFAFTGMLISQGLSFLICTVGMKKIGPIPRAAHEYYMGLNSVTQDHERWWDLKPLWLVWMLPVALSPFLSPKQRLSFSPANS